METSPSFSKMFFSSSVISLSSLIFGICLTSIECAKDVFMSTSYLPKKVSDHEWAFIIAVYSLGALFSNLIIPLININLQALLIANDMVYLLGLSILIVASSVQTIILSRFIVGIAIGLTCAAVPLYLEGIAPVSKRGLVCSMHQLFTVIGVLIGQILSYKFDKVENWRYAIYIICSLISAKFIASFFTLPIGMISDANKKSVSDLIFHKEGQLSVFTALILHAAQQMSCINGVIQYSNEILSSSSNPKVRTLAIGGVFIISTGLSMVIMDIAGRKVMLIGSIVIDTAALIMLGANLFIFPALVIYVVGYSIGLGPIVWFICAEIFPEEYKAAGTTMAVVTNLLLTFLVPIMFKYLFGIIGSKCFYVFAGYLAVTSFYLLLCLKETLGKKASFQ